ncbi:MAG: RNA recognition motif domain-containing protein [Polyangiaceae bacterium]
MATETRLYVGNLPDDVSAEELRRRFAEYGAVKNVELPTDRASGRLRGHGFVTMENAAEAQVAMSKLNGAMLDEKRLRVNIAGERDHSRVEAPVTARITSQFRERTNMVYELNCEGTRLTIKMFPEDVNGEAWRLHAFVKSATDEVVGIEATSATRASALAELARGWQEAASPTSAFKLDWPAITQALATVRAI